MPQAATYVMPARRPVMAPHRELIWIEAPHFLGWGCSVCAWLFNPSGPLIGESLEEMKMYYERQRDMDFRLHVCA